MTIVVVTTTTTAVTRMNSDNTISILNNNCDNKDNRFDML